MTTTENKISYDAISNFFDKNVKGCSYTGDFRPDHAIYVYNNDGEIEIFEKYEASGNYVFQNIDPVCIFHNGYEGRYDLEGAVWEAVQEEEESYIKPYVGVCDGWDDMEDEGKVAWLLENKADYCKEMHENTWDFTRDEYLLPHAVEKLEGNGFEIDYEN